MPLPTLHPRVGVQGRATPVAEADPPVPWRAGVTHSARAASAVSSRNCFLRLVHTSLTACWSRPTCQRPHSHAHGPGRCQKSSHSQTEGQAGGWGGRAPWGRHEVKLRRPGTLARVREEQTERHPQARLLPPAPWTEAARREELAPSPGAEAGRALLCVWLGLQQTAAEPGLTDT